MSDSHRGSCLCGAVTITVEGALGAPDACHCSQCRKWSGHVWASSDVLRDAVTIGGNGHVRWYQSSEKVRRGFCGTCGSSLLWDVAGREKIAIAMGVFEAPTETQVHLHIFTADKGDYYEIGDGVEQR